MATLADETAQLLALLMEMPRHTPEEGLTQKEIAASLGWPIERVNDRLVALGGRIRHQRKRAAGVTAVRYKLSR